ncbi:pro-neuregulin-1, membrane-bound isoform isoform X2 [Eucyclogobius newberryi]|uniref:pro-neuregulin-1, membrane-bound isoform isoform X2 n=1 Tax=Eucyclogobius newberryi TaxID=166745 RepID=UPI003B5BAF43
MTEGIEDISAGTVSPAGSVVDTGQVPEGKAEETGAADEAEEGIEAGIDKGTAQEGDSGQDEEQAEEQDGAVALPVTCCVCIQMDQINNCLHSEKICLLPILACLLSLALCTAGLKWVFVDKIFEYEPPTHLDPKRIGQDPFVISANPTMGLTLPPPHLPWSTFSPSSAFTITSGRPEVLVEDKSTQRPHVPLSPKVTQSDSSVTLKYNAEKTTLRRQTPSPQTTQGLNSNDIPTISTTSTTTTLKTSSHVTRCSDSQKNYCVNGGECFTLEIMPGSTKFLCRCPNEFTGDRCQNYVMASFYKAEELYQKRILTITGICIALLVVGIMCVVAYCRTKKERKKLHDRLKQSLRRKRKSGVSSTRGRPSSQLALQDLQLPNNNGDTVETAVEKDTETSVSTSKCALSANEPTALTHISQRYVTAVPSPCTPGSPPSEMSAPLSSLAISVPSVVLSPSGEEERPLLLSNAQQHKVLSHNQQKRSSAHYNHGQDALSLPSSPLLFREHSNYNSTSEHDPPAASYKELSEKLLKMNNNINDYNFKGATVTDGPVLYNAESGSDDLLESETAESQGERKSFLSVDGITAPLLRATGSVRTTPGSSNDTPQVLSSNTTMKQDQVAVCDGMLRNAYIE